MYDISSLRVKKKNGFMFFGKLWLYIVRHIWNTYAYVSLQSVGKMQCFLILSQTVHIQTLWD